MKKTTIILAFAMLGLSKINAQNVGIGIAAPTAKLHVNQTAGVDAILINHTGTTGIGLNSQMLNTNSTASSILSNNQGLGIGLDVLQANTGASNAALRLTNNGTNLLSRGADVYLGTNNRAIGYALLHSGTGRGIYTDLNNPANPSVGYDLRHAGTGRGLYVQFHIRRTTKSIMIQGRSC